MFGAHPTPTALERHFNKMPGEASLGQDADQGAAW